ncbi:LytR C-terminal domain-containing protein [Candidatus Parcubacteria bacterium]|nr:LytR C-terminal domain-containing protein [Candidatus Parcubacteria bacterium]
MPRKPAKKSKRISKKRSRGFSWKKFKASSRFKKSVRQVLFALVAVILTALALFGFSLYQFLNAPFIRASEVSSKETSWSGEGVFNVALLLVEDKDNPTKVLKRSLLNLNPTSAGYSLVEVPADQTLPQCLAVPVDSYILTDRAGWENLQEQFVGGDLMDFKMSDLLTLIPSFPDVLGALRRNVRTDLSLIEIYRVLRFVAGVRPSERHSWACRVEGERDTQSCDQLWQSYGVDQAVRAERKRVIVLNGTAQPGQARFGARVVENLGATVLDFTNAPRQDFETSLLIVDDRDSATSRVLSVALGIGDIRTKSEVESLGILSIQRADVVVILGADWEVGSPLTFGF